MKLPTTWDIVADQLSKDYFYDLQEFVAAERAAHEVYPTDEHVFAAFEATPYESVRVLLLGQDPYHGEGQAHGLCFSVLPGVKLPPSLRNIYKELEADVGASRPEDGYLMSWAEQGVLMLNTVLTVRANEANSHRKQGWEKFTDAVIRAVSDKEQPVVFVLWGNPAQKKRSLIDLDRHFVVESVHPSPLSASRGFFGSRPFSQVNEHLQRLGSSPIDWALTDVGD